MFVLGMDSDEGIACACPTKVSKAASSKRKLLPSERLDRLSQECYQWVLNLHEPCVALQQLGVVFGDLVVSKSC